MSTRTLRMVVALFTLAVSLGAVGCTVDDEVIDGKRCDLSGAQHKACISGYECISKTTGQFCVKKGAGSGAATSALTVSEAPAPIHEDPANGVATRDLEAHLEFLEGLGYRIR